MDGIPWEIQDYWQRMLDLAKKVVKPYGCNIDIGIGLSDDYKFSKRIASTEECDRGFKLTWTMDFDVLLFFILTCGENEYTHPYPLKVRDWRVIQCIDLGDGTKGIHKAKDGYYCCLTGEEVPEGKANPQFLVPLQGIISFDDVILRSIEKMKSVARS